MEKGHPIHSALEGGPRTARTLFARPRGALISQGTPPSRLLRRARPRPRRRWLAPGHDPQAHAESVPQAGMVPACDTLSAPKKSGFWSAPGREMCERQRRPKPSYQWGCTRATNSVHGARVRATRAPKNHKSPQYTPEHPAPPPGPKLAALLTISAVAACAHAAAEETTRGRAAAAAAA